MKRHEPVWAIVHKLRKAMGKRDDKYTIEGMIEMDKGYFTRCPGFATSDYYKLY